jgi:putative membrane protein
MEMKKMNTRIACLHKQVRVRQVLLAFFVCICLGLQTSCKDDDEDDLINADLPPVDRNFVANAAQSNLSEIELGQLALQKATDPQVKEFAQMMIDMHTPAQNELKTLGSNRNFTVADRLDEEHQSIKDQLSALSGAAFDKAYINGQVTGHQKTSAIMQTEIDNGQDADVKAYASKSKPMVDQHLALAVSIKTAKSF